MGRPLTIGEIHQLLFPIFGNTLDYENQVVGINENPNLGGKENSITPDIVPRMAPMHWRSDYSVADVSTAALFVHEMVHVWQSGHGGNNWAGGAYAWLKYDVLGPSTLLKGRYSGYKESGYEQAYKYNLANSTSLDDFNMEQQAAIIEDYYLVSNDESPLKNEGTRNSKSDYEPYVAELKRAGPFRCYLDCVARRIAGTTI